MLSVLLRQFLDLRLRNEFLFLFELDATVQLLHLRHHEQKHDHRRSNVRRWPGIEHSVEPEEQGENQEQRNQEQQLAQHGKNGCFKRLPGGLKIVRGHDLKSSAEDSA